MALLGIESLLLSVGTRLGADIGAAKAVAGIRASRKVKGCMAIDVCDESEETSDLHSFCQLNPRKTKPRLVDMHTWLLASGLWIR
jgi:hypothetical protein